MREVLKPGFTHAGKTKYSYTYDITDAIVRGKGAENQFSVQVTPGWWADKIVTPGKHVGMVGRKCAFRGVVELTFGDGSKKYYGTDLAHWKAGVTGPVLHAGIFDGETYDARELPGYVNWGVLTTPEENTEFSGEILPSAGAEIYFRPDLALAPVAAYSWRDIEGADEENYGKVVKIKDFAKGEAMRLHPGETLVVDFGQNAAAVPSFVFQAEEGTNLCCLPAEMLNDGNGAKSRGMDGPEGSVHRLNLRIPEEGLRLDYTFGPEGKAVSYTPRCTFFGYRYISVTATADVTIRSVVSIPVTSITKSLETGTVKTGDADVNKLISNTLWGQRSNYLSVPTDCPQRNERLGWMADTQVFTETGTFFANTDAFFRKWMRDVRDSQNEKGGLPGVAPTAQYGDAMMRLGWADAGVIVPWTVWKQFGDRAIIEENWAMMERFMDHIAETEYDHEALREENGNYQWADWLSYEALESHDKSAFTKDAAGKRTPTPETLAYWNYLSCCYWILDAGMMRDMAAATGRDTAKYEAMAETARAKVRASYLDGEGTFTPDTLNTMQTPALFALKCGLVEGAAKEALCARLRANFAAHENCIQTGFLGTSILMDVLTENGMAHLGALEQLHDRIRHGSEGHEQLQPLCLRLCLRLDLEIRRRHRRRPGAARFQAHRDGPGPGPPARLRRSGIRLRRREDPQRLALRRRPLDLDLLHSGGRFGNGDPAGRDGLEGLRSRHLYGEERPVNQSVRSASSLRCRFSAATWIMMFRMEKTTENCPITSTQSWRMTP